MYFIVTCTQKMMSLNNITHTYKIINHHQFHLVHFVHLQKWKMTERTWHEHTQHEQTWVSFYEDELTLKWRHNALLGLWIFLNVLAHNVFHLHIKKETITFIYTHELQFFIWDTCIWIRATHQINKTIMYQIKTTYGADASSDSPYTCISTVTAETTYMHCHKVHYSTPDTMYL